MEGGNNEPHDAALEMMRKNPVTANNAQIMPIHTHVYQRHSKQWHEPSWVVQQIRGGAQESTDMWSCTPRGSKDSECRSRWLHKAAAATRRGIGLKTDRCNQEQRHKEVP